LRTHAATFEFAPSRTLARLRAAAALGILVPCCLVAAQSPVVGLTLGGAVGLMRRALLRAEPRGVTLQLVSGGPGVISGHDRGGPQFVTLDGASCFRALMVLRLRPASRRQPLIVVIVARDALGESAWRRLRRLLRQQ
jgi:hypothetical protein